MIDLSLVTYDLPGRRLFDELSFRVNDGDRIALVGPNGSGKTTLLRMLAGSLEADSGQVARARGQEVGYLPQEGITHTGRPIIAEARSVFDDLLALRRETEEIEARMERGEVDEGILERYGDLTEEFRRHGGYEIDSRVAQVLDGLGFERSVWEKDAATLSGGWQMRLALAKLLIRRPETLLLDEPTNHLDLLAANWLEEYLSSYAGAFVLVSHDRHFLDNVVERVAELRFGKARVFVGNYTRYLEESEKEILILEERKRRQDEQIEKMEKFIGKFRYQATKAKQVQSRLKQLEKVERIELPRPQANVRFRFPDPPRSGRLVLELQHVRKVYGDNHVFDDLDLIIERGERLALVGPNGAGKSTLMRILAEREAHEGVRKLGHNVLPAYFAQDEGARLDESATVLEEVTRVAPTGLIPQLRTMLGAFLFRGDDVFKPVGVLSGGERTRVALARMLLEPHNLLLLDEPTNHLDLASKEVLLEALLAFQGTVVIVSHDRYFLDRFANRIADVGGGVVVTYPGGYEEYLDHQKRVEAEAIASAPAPAPPPPPKKPASENKVAAEPPPPGRRRGGGKSERQRREHKQRLESEIEAIEGQVRELEESMAQPGFFARPDSRQEVERHQRLTGKVEELYRRWEELGEA